MPTEINCPKCSSKNVIFSKKRNAYVCEDCEQVLPEKTVASLRIFLSYGHDEHVSLAIHLRDDLRNRKHTVWFDEERLQPGYDWEAFIEKGLEHLAADKANAAVILLLTPHSVRRPDGYCLNEVARALSRGLRIIPLMVVESELPLSICRIQWLDMRQCLPINEKEAFYRPRFERLLKAIENKQLDFEGIQQRLLKALQPLEFDADILRHLSKFTGRQWILDAIDKWLAENPPKQRVFWISGGPGVGKTAVAAVLSNRYLEVAALHLCKFGHAQKSDPRSVVTSIVYQLATQLPEYEALLSSMDLEKLVQDDARTMFDNLLIQPLSKLSPPNRSFVILVDALDEATRDGRNELAIFIAMEFPKTSPWLRLIITSRPEVEVTAPLQGLSPFIFDTGVESNLADIRDYLRRELTPHLQKCSDAQYLIEQIVAKSEGLFLYIERVCEDLHCGNLSLDRLDKFPQGLGGVYWQFFERQFPDKALYKRNIRPVLRTILAAREPLPLNILQGLFRWQSEELRDFIRTLGSLFPITKEEKGEVIKPYHKSVRDWLTDDTRAGEYFVSEIEGHKILAEFCLAEYRLGTDLMSRYALRFLAIHVISAERWDDLIGDDMTPGPLTDLRFIQAKSEVGLVHQLVSDYNAALATLPEFCEENERTKRRDASMMAYNKALREYAVARCDWWFSKERGETRSEPTYPRLPPELSNEGEHVIPEESSPRAARLRYFANFVSGQLTPLAQSPNDTLPLAYNWSASGAVAEQAEVYVQKHSLPWLKRSPCPITHLIRPQCLRTLEGHTACVLCVSVSPDGRRAVTGGADNTLRVWDLETGACLCTLEGHSLWVMSVSISPDGRRAVSGSYDTTLRVWDLESGRCLAILEGHAAVVRSVCMSPDGRHAVSGSSDNTLRVWDLETGCCLQTLEGQMFWVMNVSLSPDGRRAVTGSDDKVVRVWDLITGRCLHTLEGHSSGVWNVNVSPDGRRVISGSSDKTVRLWDLESGKCLRILEGHTAGVRSVSVFPDGRRAVTGSDDKVLRVWDLESGRCLCTFEGHAAGIRSVSVTPEGRYAVSGSYDMNLRVWDLQTSACLGPLEGHSIGVRNVSLSLDGSHAVLSLCDRNLRVWDIKNCRCLRALEGHAAGVWSASVFPDGRRAVSGSSDNTLRVWDMETGACLCTLEGHTDGIRSVSISPDGRHVISGSEDRTLRVWDIATGKMKRTIEGHASSVNSVSVSPDGWCAISGSDDKTVRFWDIETGVCLHTLEGHNEGVKSVSVSPDGRRAISGSSDKTLRIWDLNSGQCLNTLKGHGSWVSSVSISPDGLQAVSGCYDMTLRVWSMECGRCTAVYHCGSSASSVVFSSVDNRLICGTSDGKMHFLTPVNFSLFGQPLVTPVRLWLFGDNNVFGRWDDHLTCCCAYCGKRFEAPPVKAGHEPHSEKCPHCNGTLMINPFVVDHKL